MDVKKGLTMDVTVTGRHINITPDVRSEVTERVEAVLSKIKWTVIRVEVEFTVDGKPGTDAATRCEITLRGKGPVFRAPGVAEDKMVAFETALEKLRTQLRKAVDRRKSHHGLRLQDLEATLPDLPKSLHEESDSKTTVAGIEVDGDGPLVVREKTFATTPLTLAQALDEMELVGHDFFLYVDATTGAPSVVYRRRAYNYGVIHLEVSKN
jgi:ribosomal subunit interface protein